MTHFVYDPPKGDYWSVPSPTPLLLSYYWRQSSISWSSPPPENYYFWLGKDGEVDARG